MSVWLVWIYFLAGLVIAESSSNTTCFVDTFTGNVSCRNVVETFQENSAFKENCVTEYFHLRLTVQKVLSHNDTQCAGNTFNYTCATVIEKQDFLFEKELRQLEELEFIEAGKPIRFNDTKFQILLERYEVGIELRKNEHSDVRANNYYLMSASRSKKQVVEMMRANSEELAQYDRVDISPNSTVVVLSIFNENGTELPERVQITIPLHNHHFSYLPSGARIVKRKGNCVYLNVTTKKWDDSACITESSTSKETICGCNHNSAFAVVFATQSVEINKKLLTASTVLEIASIVTLLISIAVLIIYRKQMRNFDRVLVQINLCIALMLTHLFFVIGPLAANSEVFCKAVAVLSHYFLVTTAILMVMECALMLTKILAPNVFNSSTEAKKRRVIGFVVGWGVPLIYVTICTAVGFSSTANNDTDDKYIRFWGERDFCWINPTYNAVVIVPVALAIAVNTAIAIRLGVLVWKMSKSAEEYKPSNLRDVNKASHAVKALRAVIILMPILGIPWLIGFLVNVRPPFAVIFTSVHVVVNGLQGVLLFLYIIFFNSEMRASVKRTWKSTISNIVTVTPSVHFTNNRSESVSGLKGD